MYLNGALLAEEMSVTLERDTKAIEIETVVKGLAGYSPGAARTTCDVECAVPVADFELNPGKYWSNNGTPVVVEWTLFAAGRTLTFKGWIPKDKFQHGVNQASKISFSAVGQYADWV